jgi:murein endopeptidase
VTVFAFARFAGRSGFGIVPVPMRLRSLALLIPVFAVVAGGSLVHEQPPHASGTVTAGLAGTLTPIRTLRAAEPITAETPSAPSIPAPSQAVLAMVSTRARLDDPTALGHDRGSEPAVTGTLAAVVDELAEVRWTVEAPSTVEDVAGNWGMWPADLRELNPELEGRKSIAPGTQLLVHRGDPREPTRSVGAPNRGHLVAGIPLPEGPHWQLREHRPRVFGSRNTIEALLAALRSYGAEDPDAPPVRFGEISRRRGGRSNPHVSHRSGRDVDIGYVLHKSVRDTQHWWRAATADNIDARRTWELIRSLIATGEVQQIFMSAKLQRLVAAEAAKQLPPEQVASIFSATNPDPSVHTIVRHEHGHRDHFHVRFDCEDGNVRCRSESRQPGN